MEIVINKYELDDLLDIMLNNGYKVEISLLQDKKVKVKVIKEVIYEVI